MEHLLNRFVDLANEMIAEESKHPMASYIPTSELASALDLSLSDKPMDDDAFFSTLREVILKTPKTASKAFFNQLFAGRHEKAVIGECFSALLNNSMYTYKAAGPQIGIEANILSKVRDIIGWDQHSGGTFAPGGSMANFMGMIAARDNINRDIRYSGIDKTYTAYTSEHSHYSIDKNAAFAGIGRDQIRKIKADGVGKIIPSELSAQIQRDVDTGYTPFFVNATAGTTELGAYDDIHALRAICDQYQLWLHVDGAYGAAVMFSKAYKHLISGIETADSFSFNAHKMLRVPLPCSLFMVRDKQCLYDSFSNDANYLYQTDDDEFNPGKISLQCGRRNDALKFWALWKSIGTQGLEHMVNYQFYLADIARNYIRNHPDYTLCSFDDSVSVCFNYKDYSARDICTALYTENKLMVGYGCTDGKEYVRLVTINSQNSEQDLLDFFRTMEAFLAASETEKQALDLAAAPAF
ncbi:pyridoxal-dependent decarboxylase [uncultured Endozoicomonas sp.]|uniref:pyridoxal phosphate-dependent decarboxylase family protein n=1 Tax=uncultured Endozoicomonas sp. TaxID=432652 RepID=UPI00261D9A54|nr:pyridoxal-dependent decarboxylase [uncultured Endozoicomonas sp.]